MAGLSMTWRDAWAELTSEQKALPRSELYELGYRDGARKFSQVAMEILAMWSEYPNVEKPALGLDELWNKLHGLAAEEL